MDEIDRFMIRQRALRRAHLDCARPRTLWRFEQWGDGRIEEHHPGCRMFSHELTLAFPLAMHTELTRRGEEEHPPLGPDPGNQLERHGRLHLGLAFSTSRRSTLGLQPFFADLGTNGAIRTHSSSVRSVGYRLVFFSMEAIRPRFAGVHIPSVNHAPASNATILKRTLTPGESELAELTVDALAKRLDRLGFKKTDYLSG